MLSSMGELLGYESAWVEIFCNLRDGLPETEREIRGTSGVSIKASGGQAREQVNIIISGAVARAIRRPKLTTTPDEIRSWRTQVKKVEENFERVTTGEEATMARVAEFPAERRLWESLKRARTAVQVRRIYSRSNLWLKPRREFPDGSYMDWSFLPYPRALYEHAESFCRAKLDRRYPGRDERSSGDYRRIEYLARVMAGLSLPKPISPSYSIELLRKLKHSAECSCWRCELKIAPRYRRSLARFLLNRAESRKT